MKQVSFTQLMTYVRCAEHYLFRYVLHLPKVPGKAMKHGFALHETFAYHFEQKKKDSKGLKVQDAQEFFVNVFESALEDYEGELEQMAGILSREYLAREKKIKVGELVDLGVKGVEVYFKKVNPLIKPDLVETPFEFSAQKGIQVVGRIDLTDTKDVIHELKTTRHMPNMQDVRVDPQIALYYIAYQTLTNRSPKGISKDYIVMAKRESKIVRFQVSRPFLDRKTILQNVATIMDAVRHNIFYCLHPIESWVCSKEWCGFYKFHEEVKKIGLKQFMQKYSRS